MNHRKSNFHVEVRRWFPGPGRGMQHVEWKTTGLLLDSTTSRELRHTWLRQGSGWAGTRTKRPPDALEAIRNGGEMTAFEIQFEKAVAAIQSHFQAVNDLLANQPAVSDLTATDSWLRDLNALAAECKSLYLVILSSMDNTRA